MKTSPAVWIALGIGVGAALGSAMDQMSTGVGLGAAFGLVMFAVARRRQNQIDEE